MFKIEKQKYLSTMFKIEKQEYLSSMFKIENKNISVLCLR